MSVSLNHYLQDGASASAKAVLALVQQLTGDIHHEIGHTVEVDIERWVAGRCQGYVVIVHSFFADSKPYKVAFYEAASSDNIEIVEYNESIHALNNQRSEKYQQSKEVSYFKYNEIYHAADYIANQIVEYANKLLAEAKESREAS